MPQYFADIKEKEFFLTQEEAHHASTVARHKVGDEIRVFDGKGKQYFSKITCIQKKFVSGTLLSPCVVHRPNLSIELCFAPNSRTGLEEVLDKCTQLGVSYFRPILTKRSEYDVLTKWENKKERWQQIMLSACKQCNTPFLPTILDPLSFEKVLSIKKPSLLTYEAEQEHTLSWGMQTLGNPKDIRVFVGPAGGWTEEEVNLAKNNGVLLATLGVNILRAETACIAAAAKLL